MLRTLVMPAFEQGSLSRKNLSIYVVHTSKLKLVKEKRAKENLVVFAGLKSSKRAILHTMKG